MSRIPAYTVLNESIDDKDVQTWENAYQSNLLSSTNVSNYDVYKPNYSPRDYDTLSGSSDMPSVSKLYDDMLTNNAHTQDYMNRQGLYPNYSPYPPQTKMGLPSLQPQPPYNVNYPTNGYSPYDYSLAQNSNYIKSTANIPVPLSSSTALKDSREEPSMIMPNNNPLVIKHSNPDLMKENYYGTGNMNCMNIYDHVHNCPMCMGYFHRNEKSLLIIIGFLLVIIFVLLLMLFKK